MKNLNLGIMLVALLSFTTANAAVNSRDPNLSVQSKTECAKRSSAKRTQNSNLASTTAMSSKSVNSKTAK